MSVDNTASEQAILNLSKLLSRDPTANRELSQSGTLLPNQELSNEDYRLGGPLDWTLAIYPTGGDDEFVLRGDISGKVTMACRRCLEDVEVQGSSSLLFSMTYNPAVEEPLGLIEGDEDDTLVFSETEVDFADFLTQIFMVDLPLTAVCEDPETCNDLRNIIAEDTPDVIEDESENPFAVLKDIKLES